MTHDKDIPVTRAVGRFFGHLWSAVRTDSARERTELRREVEETDATGPTGERMTLRRTTIEEVEIHPDRGGA
ncbi:MAG: hypothetical protein DHS20C14_03640 [Phycisphaeraceae bacterium]|nr:MAG: hypothetical protein DHS20C14_03640 [Phycisphaeraceae bacterium]